jgi:hypothetical protein
MIDIRTFEAPGPKAAAFINSDAMVNLMMGPMRGGKTVSALYKRLRRGVDFPVCTDGIIRYSFLVVRESYGALYATTIKSWHEIFPASVGKWAGSEGRPATHELMFDTPRAPLKISARFISIQGDTIENLTRGTEFSDALLEEADLLDPGVKTYLLSRIGQYPPKKLLPPGIEIRGVCDLVTNPPDVENFCYKDFAEEPLPHHVLFQQPSGLSPQAENIKNIQGGRGYYERLAEANPPWWVDRMVHGKFGASRSAEAVYNREYDDVKHCGNVVLPIADCPIRLGLDQNLVNPACTISQWMPSGQWRVVDELVPGRMGASAFGGFIRDHLNRDYRKLPIALATADPAAAYGADKDHGELAWYETVQQKIGVPVQLAPSQEVNLRHDAVRQLLIAPDILLGNGDRVPAFRLSAKCKMLRKGFISHYRFKKRANNPDATLNPEVDKGNGFSDPHDALQYDVLNSRGRLNVVRAKVVQPSYQPARPPTPRGPPPAPGNFDVFKI